MREQAWGVAHGRTGCLGRKCFDIELGSSKMLRKHGKLCITSSTSAGVALLGSGLTNATFRWQWCRSFL